MHRSPFLLFLLPVLILPAASARGLHGWAPEIRMPTEETAEGQSEEDVTGTRWAVLVAGSSGYGNYRHQVRR